MPRRKGRSDVIKISRPRGARYAVGEWSYRGDGLKDGSAQAAFNTALVKAVLAFKDEFGERPNDEVTVIEGVISHGRASVTVFEFPSDDGHD